MQLEMAEGEHGKGACERTERAGGSTEGPVRSNGIKNRS